MTTSPASTEPILTFRDRDFKGSRLRCLLLTNQAPAAVAGLLTDLASPHASVSSDDRWAPYGFRKSDEAKLGKTPDYLLSDSDRQTLTHWWLAKTTNANTPNWDLLSSCHIRDKRGLLLIEAKAHEDEFADDQCRSTNPENIRQIGNALDEANAGWNDLMPGFNLSADSHYQLSNRFAFAWKIAMMGTPVILVYLGFIDAFEMADGKRALIKDHDQWQRCVIQKSAGVIPVQAWGETFDVNGTSLTILIRSAVVRIHAQSITDGATI
jgi:hypothetical protein